MTGSIPLLVIAMTAVINAFLPQAQRWLPRVLREYVNGVLIVIAAVGTGLSRGYAPTPTALGQLGLLVALATLIPPGRDDDVVTPTLTAAGLGLVVAALFPSITEDLHVVDRLADGLTGVALFWIVMRAQVLMQVVGTAISPVHVEWPWVHWLMLVPGWACDRGGFPIALIAILAILATVVSLVDLVKANPA